MGSRGADPRKLGEFWKKGPSWLTRKVESPEQQDIKETSQSLSEKLESRGKLLIATQTALNELEILLFKYPYNKMLRTTAIILRFRAKCRGNKTQEHLLTSEETYWNLSRNLKNLKYTIRISN